MNLLNFRKSIFRLLLYPFTVFYFILITCRNILFDKNIFKIHIFSIPVISIGNISTGGTGKTPFTIYLAGLLKGHYTKVAIISRGYHRKSKGLVVVSDGKGNIKSAEQCGDEPVLIARKLPESIVIVSENRVKGVAKAVNDFLCDLVLLDDAFQHRWINRNCDIVLLHHTLSIYNKYLLPTGNLRETYSSLKRAHLVVFTNVENADVDINWLGKYYSGSVFTSTYSPEYYLDPLSGKKYLSDQILGKTAVVFCGIAQPQFFKKMLDKQGIEIRDMVLFPDHYNYTEKDIVKIEKKAMKLNCDFIITTEKDLIKINLSSNREVRILAAVLRIDIKNEQLLCEKVKEYIDKS
jgi:tetraacyldisaccharide 4'-kinase